MANEHSQIVPSMQPTSTVAGFKFWCQKVLPLVYDDSLSYYEVLNKMLVYLNDVIDNINATTANVEELEDDFLLLQTYVNNFFDDIDQLASYATRAEAAQSAAATSATNAATSASNAATSASNSAGSASSAATSALSAMGAKDAAVAAKTAAETALANAQTAATNAANSATAAGNSATAASGSATNAAASAASALQNFQLSDAARVAAQQAANDAEAASELIDMDATAGDVGKALIVKTVGGGKVTAYEFGESGGGGGGSGNVVISIKDVAVANFNDGIPSSTLKKLEAYINPVQASGVPSPSNPLPISGYQSANIYHSGSDTSNPAIIPISFPVEAGTVYGGCIVINENNTASLIVDTIEKIINGSETWSSFVQSTARASLTITTDKAPVASDATKILKAETLETVPSVNTVSNAPYRCTMSSNADRTLFYITLDPNVVTSLGEFKSWLASNNQKIVYKIASPVEYTLSSVQAITILEGENNVWANTGNIKLLQYYVALNEYVDRQDKIVKSSIAPVLSDFIADTALSNNDFRFIGDDLYRITNSIATGGTITPNTNATKTTVGEVLKTLLGG